MRLSNKVTKIRARRIRSNGFSEKRRCPEKTLDFGFSHQHEDSKVPSTKVKTPQPVPQKTNRA